MKITLSTDDALTQKEAAEALGVTTMTIWRWIRDGKIVAVKFGNYQLIPKSEVERLKRHA